MSDWWTQPATPARSSAFHTPARADEGASLAHSHSHGQLSSSSRARFVSDDPDPSAAEGPKFLPSFAASPAGKLSLGSSPVSVASPPAPKRSPVARFSTSAESASSPRHSLLRSRTAPVPMDEDPIPTSSLHDELPARVAPQQSTEAAIELPVPSSLEAGMNTTTLHVFGPPVEYLAALRPYLENIGPVVSYTPGPDGSNWWIVEYGTALAASYALRRHGEIVSGRWMLAFKVAGPGSTQGLTLVNGVSTTAAVTPPAVGAGNPIQLKSTNIMKAKPKAAVVKDEYAWEEPEQQSGMLSRAAEFIFGR